MGAISGEECPQEREQQVQKPSGGGRGFRGAGERRPDHAGPGGPRGGLQTLDGRRTPGRLTAAEGWADSGFDETSGCTWRMDGGEE